MKQAIMLLIGLIGLFQLGHQLAGYQMVYQIAYGAITLMAMMISLTFLWLWAVRATPLALGMAFSWAGAGFVLGWWWLYHTFGQPAWARESPMLFHFLALYFVGAVFHFAVIQRSLGQHGVAFLAPVTAAILASVAVYLLA